MTKWYFKPTFPQVLQLSGKTRMTSPRKRRLGNSVSSQSIRQNIWGMAVKLNGYSWLTNETIGDVIKISQEHGTVQLDNTNFDKIKVGDVLAILPVHSCLTANLMKEYTDADGNKIRMMP